jgi:hypothetical protein
MKKIPFLVLSSDKYSDLWDSFYECFKKKFPKDVKIYFGSNSKPNTNPNVLPILSGPDKNWSESFKKILDQIDEEYLVVILEDLFFFKETSEDRWSEIEDFCINNKVNYFRYFFFQGHDLVKNKNICSNLDFRIPFRLTVCGIWKKSTLQSLLINGETAWEFEIMGSYRARDLEGFYTTNYPVLNCKNMVEKGMWIPKSVKWAKNNDINLDLSARKYPNTFQSIIMKFKKILFEAVIKVPWKYRVYLSSLVKRILISY